jgi:hypothetical protein
VKTFKDTEGIEWSFSITVAAIKRVKGLLGVDLYGLVEGGFERFGKFISSPVELIDVVYVLCKPQADARNITDEQFGERMAGDAILQARDAFVGEYIDFFPDPGTRAGLKAAMKKTREVAERLMRRGQAVIEAIDPEREANKLIASSTNGQGSSESTPAPSPSENSP